MGPVRTEVMWQAVSDALTVAGGDDLAVLDLGGGTGGDAVRLAGLGHRLTVVDPSPDALASLERRASDAGLPTGSVVAVLGDTADLFDQVEPASFDLVLCHGVLEHVDDPAAAVSVLAGALRAGGHASVVVAGRLAAVVARALAGDFVTAAALYSGDAAGWDRAAWGPRRFVVDELRRLMTAGGFAVDAVHALRVFTDLVPSALVDIEPGSREALFALERLVRDQDDFTALSGGLQCIARLDSR